MNIFRIKSHFKANLKIDVTKNRVFWSISQVKPKSEIHSPGNFLLFSDILRAYPSIDTVAVSLEAGCKSSASYKAGLNFRLKADDSFILSPKSNKLLRV